MRLRKLIQKIIRLLDRLKVPAGVCALLMLSGCAATAGSDLRDTFAGNKAQAMTEAHYGDGSIHKAAPRWSTDYFESRER